MLVPMCHTLSIYSKLHTLLYITASYNIGNSNIFYDHAGMPMGNDYNLTSFSGVHLRFYFQKTRCVK